MNKLKLFLAILCFTNFNCLKLEAKNQFKLQANYSVHKNQKLELRITQIPKKYPWVERDIDGDVVNPEPGSIIVAETISEQKLKSSTGSLIIPKGARFWARIIKDEKARSFHRKEKVSLEFFRFELNPGQSKEINLKFDSSENKTALKNTASGIGTSLAYSAAGAIAAPLLSFRILSSLPLGSGFIAGSNPYILGGSSAIGALAGLVIGSKRKGTDFHIEPGKEIKIKLEEDWLLEQLQNKQSTLASTASNDSSIFKEKADTNKLKILKVTKSKNDFDEPTLVISFKIDNPNKYKLGYSSFIVFDSLNKEYYADAESYRDYLNKGKSKDEIFELSFPVEFIKTIHWLKIFDLNKYKEIAKAEIILQH